MQAPCLADAACPTTPSELLAAVRATRAEISSGEVAVLELAVAWGHRHVEPDPSPSPDPGADPDLADPEQTEWVGIPEVRWDAPAAFAAANAMSTLAGRALIRDALVLHHRLPLVWAQVRAGRCPAHRARRVAQRVLGSASDVTAYVDAAVADRVGGVGLATLDRILDEAMMRLHPEEREAEQVEALDKVGVHLDEQSMGHTGIADMLIRGDWTDLKDFDDAVSEIAAALKVVDPQLADESLDVRRARAVGILADPETALDVLARAAAALATGEPVASPPGGRPRKQFHLHVRLTDAALLGSDPVAVDDRGRVHLDQVVRDWCGRQDAQITVRPILDLARTDDSASYELPLWMRELIIERDLTCQFPWCSRPARRCDLDHIIAWLAGGVTGPLNLAPLCRHHHRLKTHADWHYAVVEPGVYRWRSPDDHCYLRNRDGTWDLGPWSASARDQDFGHDSQRLVTSATQ